MSYVGGWEWMLLVLLVGVAQLVLFIAALISIAGSRAASGVEKGLWILISLVAPVLGPILWFVVGKRSSQGAAGRA